MKLRGVTVLLFLTFSYMLLVCNADVILGYDLYEMKQVKNGYIGYLELSGTPPSLYGTDFAKLQLNVTFESVNRVHVQITDVGATRWQVPYITEQSPSSEPMGGADNLDYEFSFTHKPFGFAVKRKEDGAVLFNTTTDGKTFNGIVFEEPYIEISSYLPSNHAIYGLGERIDNFRLKPSETYTIWNMDDGNNDHVPLYGTYPYYMEMRPNGYGHGVLLLSSNAMDVYLGDDFITYKVIGGMLDFYIFSGSSKPKEVTKQLTELVGRHYFPPFWVLGFHQCRWGYKNVEELETVVSKYKEAGIPLEVMWSDIDYMDGYRDFTLDPVNFSEQKMNDFVSTLHSNGQKFVPILDPGIKIDNGYEAYDTLLSKELYIKDKTGAPLKGKVWPGYTIFPDFTNPETFNYWKDELVNFHKMLPYDGLWIDMNELANFCDGACSNPKTNAYDDDNALSFDPDNPPYLPGGKPLYTHTIFPSAIHNVSIEYNVHSLYGFLEQKATRFAMEEIFSGKRVFSLSRSTFIGSGYNGYHWLGDNYSTFKSMKSSVTSILAMNMFGQPMVGADICGFSGDTTKELCMRWLELGAFYPFSRNHNSEGQISQEFYVFGDDMITVAKKMYSIRYSLMSYYYTQLAFAHSHGDSLIQPLFYIFPTDSNCLDIEDQFFIAKDIMVAPVLDEGKTSVDVYLPQAIWYDFYTEQIASGSQKGYTKTFDAAVDHIVVLIKGGGIIPIQDPGMTTKETMLNDFDLVVALDEDGEAHGSLYLDDGENWSENADTLVLFDVATQNGVGKLVSSFIDAKYPGGDTIKFKEIRIIGLNIAVSSVTINGVSCTSYQYDSSTKILKIPSTNLVVNSAFSVTWS